DRGASWGGDRVHSARARTAPRSTRAGGPAGLSLVSNQDEELGRFPELLGLVDLERLGDAVVLALGRRREREILARDDRELALRQGDRTIAEPVEAREQRRIERARRSNRARSEDAKHPPRALFDEHALLDELIARSGDV